MTPRAKTIRTGFFAAMIAAAAAASGCAEPGQRATVDETEAPQGPALTQAALDFGDWQLPPDANVLLSKDDYHRDPNYKLAVEVSPEGLVWMLSESKFSAPFDEGLPVYNDETIAGPPLSTSPRVKEAQDMFVSKEGDSMIRAVVVDERTPELRIVHLEFRGQ
ncbi:hypothetical protein ACWF82_09030 [Nocardia sp. NPDC055053]